MNYSCSIELDDAFNDFALTGSRLSWFIFHEFVFRSLISTLLLLYLYELAFVFEAVFIGLIIFFSSGLFYLNMKGMFYFFV